MKKEHCKLTGKELIEKKSIDKVWGAFLELTYELRDERESIYVSEKLYNSLTETVKNNYGYLIPAAQINKKIDLSTLIIYDQAQEDLSSENNCISLEELQEKLADIGPHPKTQKEKFNNLFLTLLDFQKHDGEDMELEDFSKAYPYESLYFRNWDERNFYLATLLHEGLIEGKQTGPKILPVIFSITYKGLNYGVELQQSSAASTQCFVAMSFAADMQPYREAIKAVCREVGFQAMLIDEAHYDSDQTINEAMIVEIKKSRFCIADFTHQRQNVYFEAGFALGLGIPVIYTCHSGDMEDRHFDTRQFPHLAYADADQLKKDLLTKIQAWIV